MIADLKVSQKENTQLAKSLKKQFGGVYFLAKRHRFCVPIQQKHTPQTCFLNDFAGWVVVICTLYICIDRLKGLYILANAFRKSLSVHLTNYQLVFFGTNASLNLSLNSLI